MVGAFDRQSEPRHVFDRLAIEVFEIFVAGTQFEHGFAPFLQRLAELRAGGVGDAGFRRPIAPPAGRDRIFEAAVPDPARLDRDFEAAPPIRVKTGRAVAATHGLDLAHKIAVAVAGNELRLVLRPFGGDPAAPDQMAAFDFEEIGKIAAHRDFEIELDRVGAVVGDVDVFVQAAFVDRASELEEQRSLLDIAVLGNDPGIGHKDLGSKISDRT